MAALRVIGTRSGPEHLWKAAALFVAAIPAAYQFASPFSRAKAAGVDLSSFLWDALPRPSLTYISKKIWQAMPHDVKVMMGTSAITAFFMWMRSKPETHRVVMLQPIVLVVPEPQK